MSGPPPDAAAAAPAGSRHDQGLGPPATLPVIGPGADGADPAAADASAARAAQLAAGPPGISRRTIWLGIAALAVLGVGGAIADQSFNVTPMAAPAASVPRSGPAPQSLARFVGLRDLAPRPAPALGGLRQDGGLPFALRGLAGRPVVLAFLPGGCGGVCRVITAELSRAERDLSGSRSSPAVVVVDTDPRLAVPLGAASSSSLDAIGRGGSGVRAAVPGAVFLDGTLPALQATWKAYGVTIELDPASGALAYTEVLYLLDRSGRLRYSLTPFADQAFTGQASLPASQLDRFASGIATYLQALGR